MHDLHRLATLVAVAEAGSINRAAARLGYTPPALSQQLAKLEREVGMTLLVRSSRGVSLTQAGNVLVDYSRRIIQTLDEANDALRQVAGLAVGRVRIGSFTTGGMYVLPSAILEFRRLYPQIDTSLHEYEPPAATEELLRGQLDLVITHSYEHGLPLTLEPSLTSEVLMVEELVLVSSPNHELTRTDGPVSIKQLAEWPLITGPRGLANREALERLFRSEGLDAPTVSFETGNYAIACSLATSGPAIALIPAMVLTHHLPQTPVAVHRLAEPGLHRTIVLVWRLGKCPPEVDDLRSLIKQACDRLRGNESIGSRIRA